jgi:hypothetical protein
VARGEHWATFECTARLTILELEAGDLDAARPRWEALGPLADRLGTRGSEAAFAPDTVTDLERLDAGFLTPDLLGIAAEAEYRAGEAAAATAHATRALELARSTGRPLEAARARVLLASIAAGRGAIDEAEAHLQAVAGDDRLLPYHVADKVSPCLPIYDVTWLSSYIASDGSRCVCVYEAENVWAASPLHRSPEA